jgi:L-aminopeptidase/D-esterase-like protein
MADAAARMIDLDDSLPGVAVGHWTDEAARTGCTVVLLPPGTVASGEVRGGAPATREFDLLGPERLVDRIDAVVLTGGSTFGLAAADGVVHLLAQRGIGFPTAAGPVPIVVAMGLFDLLVGDGSVRPRADHGHAAATHASSTFTFGAVGAGAGATAGKWRGRDLTRDSGLGAAVVQRGELAVLALIAVNAFGDIDDGDDRPLIDRIPPAEEMLTPDGADAFTNTTIGLIATNATLGKGECLLVAQSGHDGFARALFPSHTRVDGDALVVAATGSLARTDAVDEVRLLAVAAVEQAIRAAAPEP